MKKRKVLILGKLPPPYMGPAIATEIILNSSLKNNFVLLHLDTKANESLSTLGKWSLRKLFRNIGIYFRLISMLAKERPDLVLIPVSQSTLGFIKDFVFIALSRISGRKVLLHLRGSNFQNWIRSSHALIRFFVIHSLRLCKGVIVLGKNLKPLFQGIFQENKIFVVPNGGNYALSFSVKSNTPLRILYLGNLQSSKGIEDVILAISLLDHDSVSAVHLDVVGNWRDERTREMCFQMVKEKKLPVKFHPPASGNNKMKFLAEADIFIFTPRMPEGHPWVIVEAMAAGLPIISTNRGAIVESVHDGENGFIVEAESPQSITDKIKVLLNNRELREKMGRESRRSYEANFTEDKMVQSLTETFNAVMND